MNVWTVLRSQWYWCEIRQKADFLLTSFEMEKPLYWKSSGKFERDWKMLLENHRKINLQRRNCWTFFNWHKRRGRQRKVRVLETCFPNSCIFMRMTPTTPIILYLLRLIFVGVTSICLSKSCGKLHFTSKLSSTCSTWKRLKFSH